MGERAHCFMSSISVFMEEETHFVNLSIMSAAAPNPSCVPLVILATSSSLFFFAKACAAFFFCFSVILSSCVIFSPPMTRSALSSPCPFDFRCVLFKLDPSVWAESCGTSISSSSSDEEEEEEEESKVFSPT